MPLVGTTETSRDPGPDRGPLSWRSLPWRVLVGRFVVMSAVLALVVWLMPGLRTSTDLTWLDVALMSITWGLLEVTIRPVLDLLFVRFVVPTYGLVLLLVDVAVFALLVLIFSGSLEVSSLAALVIGGALIGLLRLAIEAVLGFYEGALASGANLELTGPVRCAGNCAAFPFRVVMPGMTVSIIDVFEFDESSGKVTSMKAYWGPESMETDG